MSRIAIVGGHGQVARHLLVELRRTEHTPVALVRREEYRADLESRGAEVRLLDIEQQGADGFAEAFAGCDAVVFAAGGGPDGNKERKRTVDLEGSLKSIAGAETAGIRRFVQVSAINVDDAAARGHRRGLARLRGGEAGRRRRTAGQRPRLDDHPTGSAHRRPGDRARVPRADVDRGDVTRADVAAVVAAVLDVDSTVGRQWNLVNGDTAVAEAVRQG